MALHIHSGSARLGPQRGLSGAGRDDLLDAGQTASNYPRASQPDPGDQFFIECKTGQPARIPGQYLGGHHDIAGFQGRVEPSGNAKADDAPERGWIKRRKQCPQLPGIATAADHGHARTRCNARLLHQTRHNQYRPRVNSIARGNLVHRPQIHIPTPTTLLLVLLKFRYRASAQSGKNFE